MVVMINQQCNYVYVNYRYVSTMNMFIYFSQQCNIEAMYASVPSDVIDNPKDKEAWIQNSIDQQRRIVAKIRSQPWSMAKKKEALG